MKIKYLFIILGFTVLSCSTASDTPEKISADELFEQFFEFKLKYNSLQATQLGLEGHNDKLPNFISNDYRDEVIARIDSFLLMAEKVDTAGLDLNKKMALEALKWDCQVKREGLSELLEVVATPQFDLPVFRLMPLNQIFSQHLFMSQQASGMGFVPFKTVKDYEDWLKRIDDYIAFMDTAMVRMNEGMEEGIVLPAVITDKMIPQLNEFIESPYEEHLYYQPVLNFPESVGELDRERLTTDYQQMVVEKIIPKFRELKMYLENEYLPLGRMAKGISDFPYGERTYNYLIKYHTSTDMTADEIFELGESEVARITAEMEKVKNDIGFEGDLKAFFRFIEEHEDLSPYHDPAEVIAHYEKIHEKMKDKLGTMFNLTPQGSFEVRRVESFREASASAEYISGSKDGSRPGIFYVPIPDVENYNILTSEALFLHEAIPGHHYQLSLQQENEKLPAFMHAEGMGVFVEGWALYAESLGKELGLYDDPYQYFGMLSQEMHRAIRLVVDAGLHAKGWTREEAIQYSLEHEAISEEGAIAEIERYMVAPGQALAYKIGQLKILELRKRAEKELGEKFKLAEFHDQVLNTGSLPLVLLEQKIDNWIKSK